MVGWINDFVMPIAGMPLIIKSNARMSDT